MYVPQNVMKSVGFVYGNRKGKPEADGTAFFVIILDTASNFRTRYAVTARHVLDGIETDKECPDKKVLIRLNLIGGSLDYIETNLRDWVSHPDRSVDVAVIQIDDELVKGFDVGYVPNEYFMNDDAIALYSVGPGDEVAIAGLYSLREGRNQNLPIVRIGNISAMPSERVDSPDFHEDGIIAYLIEARSFGGLSGSPVFANLGQDRRVGSHTFHANLADRNDASGIFILLGLIHAHNDEIIAQKIESRPTGGIVRINMGIAIVVPMKQILEVLNQPRLINERTQAMAKEKRKNAPTLDSVLNARSVVEAAIGEPLTEPRPKPKKKAKKAS